LTPLRYYLDEHIPGAPKAEKIMQSLGMDVLSTQSAQMLGADDDEQIAFAARERRVFLTFNIRHFTRREKHAGIILGENRNFKHTHEVVRALKNFHDRKSKVTMNNVVERLESYRI